MLYNPNVDAIQQPFPVSGQYLARNKLTARQRARLALDILERRAEISHLTLRQVAKLCRVSIPLIDAARKSPSDSLVKAWNACTNDERVEFAQRIGVARVWDEAIAPALD